MNSRPPTSRSCFFLPAATAVMLGLSALPLWSDTIALWNFPGSLPGNQVETPVTSVLPGMGATSITRGTGVTASASGGTMSSSGWTQDATIDANDYYEFGLTISPGDVLDLDSISLSERRSGTGIRVFTLRSSRDNYATDVGAPISVPDDTNNRDQVISLPAEFNALTSSITFRLYGYSAEQSGGTWRLQNHSTEGGLKIQGTYTAAVPPGSITVELTPNPVAENAGAGAVTGKVKLSAVTPTDVIVNLSSSDTSEAILPAGGAIITVPQGTDQASFLLDIVDDSIYDGSVAVNITATALGYNPGTGTLTVTDHGDAPTLIINEVLADPFVDVNGNGIFPEGAGSNPADDEYIEFVNISGAQLDISGWTIYDAGNASPRHTFPPGTVLATGQAIVVFGGSTGLPTSINGALVQGANAPSNGLAINNAGDTMTLKDALGVTRDVYSFGNGLGNNQSMTRSPDLTGTFVNHSAAPGAVGNYSLGTKLDGTPFAGTAYATWIDGFYPGNADPGTIGFLADPDADGVVNGIEASMGTAPNDALSVARLVPTSALPGILSYDQPKSRIFLTDVISKLEWSTDLLNWQQSGVAYGGVNVLLSQNSLDTSGPVYDVAKGTGIVTEGAPERIYLRVNATKTSP